MAVTLGVTCTPEQGQRLGFNIVTLWASDRSCPAAFTLSQETLQGYPGAPLRRGVVSEGRNTTLQFHEVPRHPEVAWAIGL